MIELSEFKSEWHELYVSFKQSVLKSAGGMIIDIEHIGSTSIDYAKAKDIIDVQLSINSFNQLDEIKAILEPLGFEHIESIKQDHVPFHEFDYFSDEWEKRFFTGLYKGTKFNIHVRLHGSKNWHFALQFKNYLSKNDKARVAFMQFKERLAQSGIDSFNYCIVKDSVIDLMSLQFDM